MQRDATGSAEAEGAARLGAAGSPTASAPSTGARLVRYVKLVDVALRQLYQKADQHQADQRATASLKASLEAHEQTVRQFLVGAMMLLDGSQRARRVGCASGGSSRRRDQLGAAFGAEPTDVRGMVALGRAQYCNG